MDRLSAVWAVSVDFVVLRWNVRDFFLLSMWALHGCVDVAAGFVLVEIEVEVCLSVIRADTVLDAPSLAFG